MVEKLTKRLKGYKGCYCLKSPSSGREVANQMVIKFENGEIFQSYNSIIAIRFYGGKVYITDKHDYSNTTRKYRNIYFGDDRKGIERMIDNKELILIPTTKK